MRELLGTLYDKLEQEAPLSRRRKRAPGAGRPSKLTEQEIERGIKLLFSGKVLLSPLPMNPKRVCELLRETLGVNVSDLTLRRRIIKPGFDRLRDLMASTR